MLINSSASFFIKDYHSAQIKDHFFIYANCRFKNVSLLGNLIKFYQIKDATNGMDFFIFTVDDGTGTINCLLAIKETETATAVLGFNGTGEVIKINGVLRQEKRLRYICIKTVEKVSRLKEKISYYNDSFHMYDYLNSV